jgi:hypothetical protein
MLSFYFLHRLQNSLCTDGGGMSVGRVEPAGRMCPSCPKIYKVLGCHRLQNLRSKQR